jgi:hypothetical protein
MIDCKIAVYHSLDFCKTHLKTHISNISKITNTENEKVGSSEATLK